ncbi:unnamed protein product [Ilex paraguariensis]|uniref:Uncharacterized protein n=1 Tax=Ilex paraguariensis TaxID=185542 RepID=A0ABC8QN68_9AQUA
MSPALSAAIRGMIDCWVPIKLEEATGLVIRFVIGRTSDKSKMTEHRKEVAEYDDFMLLDIEEYSKLPYKTLVLTVFMYKTSVPNTYRLSFRINSVSTTV